MSEDISRGRTESQSSDYEKREAEFLELWASAAARALQAKVDSAEVYAEGLFAGDAHTPDKQTPDYVPQGDSEPRGGDSP